MLLTLSCAASDALPDSRAFGFLLHKHPDRLFEKTLTFGTARVFYPEATAERTSVALSVTLDPVAMVRGKSATLAEYVSDRPYAPSSFLSVALSECFGTALNGRCDNLPDAVDAPLALSATLPALSCDGGASAMERAFAPLGYTVSALADPPLLDDRFPEWGSANVFTATIAGTVRLRDLLGHLYVLVPVLDNAKHYFVAEDEVEKLLRRGDGWLGAHPAKEWIAARYLRYRHSLTDAALLRLADVAEDETLAAEPDAAVAPAAEPPAARERRERLNDRRVAAAVQAIATFPHGAAKTVLDLGCGEGTTLAAVRKAFPALEKLTGVDVAPSVLARAARKLKIDRAEGEARDRLELLHGSLTYRDARTQNFDVALLTEVIEHIDPERLPDVAANVFGFARPRRVIVTTPNADYNSVWETLPEGKFRHSDHRFEWTRVQFETWASQVATRYDYAVTFSGIGDVDPKGRGTPTQRGVFDVISR